MVGKAVGNILTLMIVTVTAEVLYVPEPSISPAINDGITTEDAFPCTKILNWILLNSNCCYLGISIVLLQAN